MTISDTLTELWELADNSGVNLGGRDDEDLIIFALHYLMAHLTDAFECMDGDSDEKENDD